MKEIDSQQWFTAVLSDGGVSQVLLQSSCVFSTPQNHWFLGSGSSDKRRIRDTEPSRLETVRSDGHQSVHGNVTCKEDASGRRDSLRSGVKKLSLPSEKLNGGALPR
jgi:hypothetical protein